MISEVLFQFNSHELLTSSGGFSFEINSFVSAFVFLKELVLIGRSWFVKMVDFNHKISLRSIVTYRRPKKDDPIDELLGYK